jgi:putative peptidoglycan lipid II flippase
VATTPETQAAHARPAHVSQRRLVGAAAVIGLGNVLSRALGLVRDQVIAAVFGATAGTDAYVLARTLPTIQYDLLVGSVSTAAFVPVFVQYARDERQFWRMVSAIFSLAGLAFVVLASVLALLADPLVALIGSGFDTPDQRQLAATLMRWALVSVVLQGLAGVLTSALYAQNRFALPAFASAIYNAGIIVGILLLASTAGIQALAFGLVLGAVAQLGLQAAGLRAFWRAYRQHIDLADPGVRRILVLGGTVGAGLLVTIAGQLIDRNLASRLPDGSLTLMQFSTAVIQFPLGIVGLAASYAVLPTLARFGHGVERDQSAYREALLVGLKLVFLLMLPALAGLVVLAHPLMQVLFERGAFRPEDTLRARDIFLAYAPMLPMTAVDYLLINAFYARLNARTPVLVGVLCVLLYLVVALALIGPYGAVGLAFANAVQNSAHGLILLILLERSLPGLKLAQGLVSFLARTIPAAALTGGAVWLAWPILAPIGTLAALLASIALGAATHSVLVYALRVPEARAAVNLVRARLRR